MYISNYLLSILSFCLSYLAENLEFLLEQMKIERVVVGDAVMEIASTTLCLIWFHELDCNNHGVSMLVVLKL
jgi:hypothetical protein